MKLFVGFLIALTVAGCSADGASVWRSDSVAIALTNTGWSPATFSACSGGDMTWTFDARSGQAMKAGCINATVLDRTGGPPSQGQSEVIAALRGLRTIADNSTIADAPEVNVVITDTHGIETTYSGIPWSSPAPAPTIDSDSLFALEALLDSFVDRPLLFGEWCDAVDTCGASLTCRVDADGGTPAYCHN